MARYSGDGKNTLESCRSIDVLQWHRLGYLRSPGRFSCAWTRGGERVASIFVRAQRHAMMLKYQSRSYGEDWTDWAAVHPWAPENESCRWTAKSSSGNRARCGRRSALDSGMVLARPWPERNRASRSWDLRRRRLASHPHTSGSSRAGLALHVTLERRVVPAPQRCATHFLWPLGLWLLAIEPVALSMRSICRRISPVVARSESRPISLFATPARSEPISVAVSSCAMRRWSVSSFSWARFDATWAAVSRRCASFSSVVVRSAESPISALARLARTWESSSEVSFWLFATLARGEPISASVSSCAMRRRTVSSFSWAGLDAPHAARSRLCAS